MDLGQNNHDKKTTPGGDAHSVQGPFDPPGFSDISKLIACSVVELSDGKTKTAVEYLTLAVYQLHKKIQKIDSKNAGK